MLPRNRPLLGEPSSLIKKHRVGGWHLESTTTNQNSDAKSGNIASNCDSSEAIMAMGDLNPADIHEDLHSRETIRRLFASNVLISGMQGLGVEIARKLILAGVKSVTLHNEGAVELWDLSTNFVFTVSDVGKNRALASLQKLLELNNAVAISTLTASLTKDHLSHFQAVVFTDISLEKAVEFNDYCHSHQPPISFIKAEVRGLFGSIFCDFGPEFTVVDVDGKDPHTGIIASISNDNPAIVSCVDDERLEFEDGDLVVFSEVHGMTELNDGKPRKIKNARPYSFTLEEDTTKLGTYKKGGIVTQVKLPKVLNFKPLREAVKDPGDFLLSDFSKLDRPPLLHLAFQALDKFISKLGRFPVAGSEEDAQKLISLASSINEGLGDGRVEDINPKLLRHFAFGTRAVLNPMAAMFGGIVGQEVVKACSGKFHPLFQLFYFDSGEVNACLSSPAEYINATIKAGDAQARDMLERVLECLERGKCETFQDCITWARLKFEVSNRVKQLIYTFPEDAVTITSAPFWSASKRFPQPLQFSTRDPTHLNYVLAGSILRAETFGIPIPDLAKDPQNLAEAIDRVMVPDFQPKKEAKIVTDEKATSLSTASVDDDAVIGELIKKLEHYKHKLPSKLGMKPIQFEKDALEASEKPLLEAFQKVNERNSKLLDYIKAFRNKHTALQDDYLTIRKNLGKITVERNLLQAQLEEKEETVQKLQKCLADMERQLHEGESLRKK